MMPLYAARIEDLRQGDFVKVDCAACHHVALLAPEFLLRLGLSPQTKVLDLKERVRCRGCGARGASRGFGQVAGAERVACNQPAGLPWAAARRWRAGAPGEPFG
jgi:ribosomal protein S27E